MIIVKQTKLKVLYCDHTPGYKMSDIEKELGKEEYKRFCDWYYGQTGMSYKGEPFVYEWDYERFLEGLEPID